MELKPQVDWREFLQMVLKRKWFFIVPFACIFFLAIIMGFAMPKVYEAKATILVEEEKIVNPLLSELAVSTSVERRLHRLNEEILSWPRLLQLVEGLNLNKDVNSAMELEGLIQSIRDRISLRMKGGDIIVISYEGGNPQSTQKVVNTLCEILISKNILAQNAEADSAITFIEKQLAVYQGKLEQSENALRKFKETYGLQMPLATRINEDLANLEAELTNTLVDCTEDHPRVIDLRRRIASLTEKRVEQIEQAAKNLDSTASQDYVNIAYSIPKQEEELARLTRDQSVNADIYAMLLNRLETARISQQLESSENKTKFKIVEPARLPLKPIRPNKLKINFLGLVFGGMVAFGSTYLVESTDHSFSKSGELKSAFGLPTLGSISKIITQNDVEKAKTNTRRTVTIVSAVVLLLAILLLILVRL
ncbi:GNVR domain-containing protein [Candidatus Omnitrophota bacterium]